MSKSSSPPHVGDKLLTVTALSVGRLDRLTLVDAVSFSMRLGETLAIVGGSGSGKTLCCRAIAGLLPAGLAAMGSVRFAGVELLGAPEAILARHRGRGVSVVFQDSDSALNPLATVGRQFAETMCPQLRIGRRQALDKAEYLLTELKLPNPRVCMSMYPHQLSGGMRQRVLTALALSVCPKLLITDESTRSLDPAAQKAVFDLFAELQRSYGMAHIMISHDLELVERCSDNVVVMHKGACIEHGLVSTVFAQPRHSYTKGLLEASVSMGMNLRAGAEIRSSGESLA